MTERNGDLWHAPSLRTRPVPGASAETKLRLMDEALTEVWEHLRRKYGSCAAAQYVVLVRAIGRA